MKRISVRFIHAAITLIIAVQFILAWTMPGVRRNAEPGQLLNLHMSFGVLVLPFVVAFFLTRFYRTADVERDVNTMPHFAQLAASSMYYLLYTLLVLVPLSGWSYASAHAWTVTLFGTVDLPQLFANSTVFGLSVAQLHGALASLLGILIIGHALAALVHHFILKDSVLRNMLPSFRTPPV